ncbi:hypothetical protein HDU67_007266 [Dinochytrium kinnereticum]|nr:hypothetical protein HDU67_007266 [Dinochytrium kinnereticum]
MAEVEFGELASLLEANEKHWKRHNSSLSTSRPRGHLQRVRKELRKNVESWCRDFAVTAQTHDLARLLAPELDMRRYGLRENSLCSLLLTGNSLGTQGLTSVENKIRNWRASGNLPQCVHDALLTLGQTRRSSGSLESISLTIGRLNRLLGELSSCCSFTVDRSGRQLNRSCRNQSDIVRDIFVGRAPLEIKWIIAIILKFQTVHPSVILGGIHTRFWHVYRHQTDLLVCCHIVDRLLSGEDLRGLDKISVGVHFSVMKLKKGSSPAYVVKQMRKLGHTECYAEVKYDGERMQVHVSSRKVVAIFSKSGRNSTQDRILSHDIVLSALGIGGNIKGRASGKPDVHSAILEGELLSYKDGDGVEAFSAVRDFVTKRPGAIQDINEGRRHYQIMFFDILQLNGQVLINEPYTKRRKLLLEVVHPIPEYAGVSESHLIDLRESDEIASENLRNLFVEVCSRPAEGLVVKGCRGEYVPGREASWFKLKKDYIDGFADTAEFALLGGSYSEQASKYLHLSREDEPTLLNIFYVGCRTGAKHTCPSFIILFDLTAGFNREELVQLSKATLPMRRNNVSKLSYLLKKGPVSERVVEFFFDPPLAVELMGGGFDRKFGFWYMRGPRLLRQCPAEKTWRDTLSYSQFELIAKNAMKSVNFGHENVKRLSAVDARVLSGGRQVSDLRRTGSKIWADSFNLGLNRDNSRLSTDNRRDSSDLFDSADESFDDQSSYFSSDGTGVLPSEHGCRKAGDLPQNDPSVSSSINISSVSTVPINSEKETPSPSPPPFEDSFKGLKRTGSRDSDEAFVPGISHAVLARMGSWPDTDVEGRGNGVGIHRVISSLSETEIDEPCEANEDGTDERDVKRFRGSSSGSHCGALEPKASPSFIVSSGKLDDEMPLPHTSSPTNVKVLLAGEGGIDSQQGSLNSDHGTCANLRLSSIRHNGYMLDVLPDVLTPTKILEIPASLTPKLTHTSSDRTAVKSCGSGSSSRVLMDLTEDCEVLDLTGDSPLRIGVNQKTPTISNIFKKRAPSELSQTSSLLNLPSTKRLFTRRRKRAKVSKKDLDVVTDDCIGDESEVSLSAISPLRQSFVVAEESPRNMPLPCLASKFEAFPIALRSFLSSKTSSTVSIVADEEKGLTGSTEIVVASSSSLVGQVNDTAIEGLGDGYPITLSPLLCVSALSPVISIMSEEETSFLVSAQEEGITSQRKSCEQGGALDHVPCDSLFKVCPQDRKDDLIVLETPPRADLTLRRAYFNTCERASMPEVVRTSSSLNYSDGNETIVLGMDDSALQTPLSKDEFAFLDPNVKGSELVYDSEDLSPLEFSKVFFYVPGLAGHRLRIRGQLGVQIQATDINQRLEDGTLVNLIADLSKLDGLISTRRVLHSFDAALAAACWTGPAAGIGVLPAEPELMTSGDKGRRDGTTTKGRSCSVLILIPSGISHSALEDRERVERWKLLLSERMIERRNDPAPIYVGDSASFLQRLADVPGSFGRLCCHPLRNQPQ